MFRSRLWILSGWILGVLGWSLSGDLRIAVLGALFGIVVVWISRDPGWVLTGGVLSICVVALPVLLWSWLFGRYLVWGWLIVLAVGCVWLVLSVSIRRGNARASHADHSIWLSALGVIWIMLAARHDWSPVGLLVRVGSMGEDNGAFLNNVALTGSGLSAVLGRESGVDGGVVLGLVITFGNSVHGIVSDQNSAPLFASEALIRLYDTLGNVFSGLCVLFGLNRSRTRSVWVDAALSAATGFGAIVFISGLYRAAHLAALVFVIVASLTLVLSQQFTALAKGARVWNVLLYLPLLLLGQAWWPAVIVTIIGITMLLGAKHVRIRQSLRVLRFSPSARKGPLLLTVACLVIIALNLGFRRTLVNDLALSASISQTWSASSALTNFQQLMRLVGDDVRVAGWFSIALMVLGLLSLRSSWQASPSQVLIVALSIASVMLMVVGWLVPPFEPQYGPNKMLYLASMVLFPVAITEVSELAAKRSSLLSGALAICVTTGLFVASATPLVELTNRIRQREPVGWATGVAASFAMWPDRLVTCLSTRVDGPPDDAWRCSRLLAGMQGMNYPTDALKNQPYSRALKVIYGANICAVSSEHVADISLSDFSRLTLVISDGDRLSTEGGCQAKGWASTEGLNDDRWLLGVHSGIRWDLVKMVSYEGTVVNPSFKYLDKSSNYAEADIERLESKLR